MKTLAILSGQQGCRAPDSHTLGHPGQRPQKQQLEQPSASRNILLPIQGLLYCKQAPALSKASTPISTVKPGIVMHPC